MDFAALLGAALLLVGQFNPDLVNQPATFVGASATANPNVGAWTDSGNVIHVTDRYLTNPVTLPREQVVALVLAHELTHVRQNLEHKPYDCVRQETEAYLMQGALYSYLDGTNVTANPTEAQGYDGQFGAAYVQTYVRQACTPHTLFP